MLNMMLTQLDKELKMQKLNEASTIVFDSHEESLDLSRIMYKAGEGEELTDEEMLKLRQAAVMFGHRPA